MAPTLYEGLYNAHKKRFSDSLSKSAIQKKCNSAWKKLKEEYRGDELVKVVQDTCKKLNEESSRRSIKLLNFFVQASTRKSKDDDTRAHSSEVVHETEDPDSPVGKSRERPAGNPIANSSDKEADEEIIAGHFSNRAFLPLKPAPAQECMTQKISALESQLNGKILAKGTDLAEPGCLKDIGTLEKKLSQAKCNLKRLQYKAVHERKYREVRKANLQELVEKNNDVAKKLKVRGKPGRPRTEEDQQGLLDVIINIAKVGSAADERRRSEVFRSVKTLDELHEALLRVGLNLSRSATYLRLLPRDSRNSEGKRHVSTVPVKLSRPQTSLHKTHDDGKFCTATIRSVETVASLLGPSQCAVISQDDKARVPLGITAANKQSPLLMHVEYKVSLPDHDWVVAPRHKLIPSVYAGIVIEEGKIDGDPALVTYSGPTYVAIRSGKHTSSTASSHAYDFEKLCELPEFQEILKVNGQLKPVLIFSVDGGPDESPRYTKVILHAIDHFKRHNLDALYIFTNAPGRSAFNRVERRMAPLSKLLSGVVLPHDQFGSHLDASCRTVDKDLELKNFKRAGEVLGEVWSSVMIDGHPVKAQYVEPECEVPLPSEPPAEWYCQYVRESQYFLQISKCDNTSCCMPMRSDLKKILPDGFFPAPFPVRRGDGGLYVPEPDAVEETDTFPSLLVRLALNVRPSGEGLPDLLPYDMYSPTTHDKVLGRTCRGCGAYFASKKNASLHQKQMHKSLAAPAKFKVNKILTRRADEVLCEVDPHELTWEPLDSVDGEGTFEPYIIEDTDDTLPVVNSLDDWLSPLWVES